jgi:RNA polymerase sigma factor (sigma-70 family)
MDRTEEFQWLFATEYAAVVRATYLVLHDHALAEEITQDAFVQVLRHWAKVRDYDSPGAWVRRVAIRLAIRQAHRERRRAVLTRSTTGQHTEPAADERAGDDALLDAVLHLSPQQRSVVVLFYFEDRPMDEIADIIGCSTSTGWVHLHKARKRLATLLHEEVGADVG